MTENQQKYIRLAKDWGPRAQNTLTDLANGTITKAQAITNINKIYICRSGGKTIVDEFLNGKS
jgi:hypothetical protein